MVVISVIICTYNRCISLKDTLDSIFSQACDGIFDYEVIVIDNNSKDNTKVFVESYMPKFNRKLRYLFEPIQGKSHALNTGIKEAKGEIIVFTDDDVIVDQNWLLNIWQCFQDYNCDGVGGRILPLYPDKTPNWIKDNKDLLGGPIVFFDHGEQIKVYDKKNMFPFVGANMSFKKDCFVECGLFRTNLGPGTGSSDEDTEFFIRLMGSDKKLYYCGKALIWHPVEKERMNYAYLAKWFLKEGRAFVRRNAREKKIIFYFGIPRYIIKDVSENIIFLALHLFNKRGFLMYWREIFVNIGYALEYRKLNICQK